MNFNGILFGLVALISIGLGFVWVIKLEYYIGAHMAKAVAALGLLITLASVFIPNFTLAAAVGIIGGTILWGSTELPDQQKRVAAGMFPANPKKHANQHDLHKGGAA